MAARRHIKIVAGIHFTTGTIGEEPTAVKWQAEDGNWYVAGPGSAPHCLDNEDDASEAFLKALGMGGE